MLGDFGEPCVRALPLSSDDPMLSARVVIHRSTAILRTMCLGRPLILRGDIRQNGLRAVASVVPHDPHVLLSLGVAEWPKCFVDENSTLMGLHLFPLYFLFWVISLCDVLRDMRKGVDVCVFVVSVALLTCSCVCGAMLDGAMNFTRSFMLAFSSICDRLGVDLMICLGLSPLLRILRGIRCRRDSENASEHFSHENPSQEQQ